MSLREWILFLPQTPVAPSSLRVQVWRRLQSVGSISLHTGIWVLPRTPEHEHFLHVLIEEVARQGGMSFLFSAQANDMTMEERIIARFQQARTQEYTEFCERCQAFLDEIAKETRVQKLAFAELEENEDDLQKLTVWFRKIRTRDFFGGDHVEKAEAALVHCREVLQDFTTAVYAHEGLDTVGNMPISPGLAFSSFLDGSFSREMPRLNGSEGTDAHTTSDT